MSNYYFHKTIVLESTEKYAKEERKQVFRIQIREKLEAGYGGYSWPSSFVLAALLASNQPAFARNSLQISRMVELGAGCGVAGLAYASLFTSTSSKRGGFSSPKLVLLTDRFPDLLDNLQNQIIVNKLDATCGVELLDWLEPETTARLLISTKSNNQPFALSPNSSSALPYLLLGADVFYDPSLFDGLLKTISLFVEESSDTIFLTTYHERSSKRSLTPLLKRYGLKGIYIASGQEILDKLHEQDFLSLTFGDAQDYETTESSLQSVFLFAICSSKHDNDVLSNRNSLVNELLQIYETGRK